MPSVELYALEKFDQAIHELITHPGRVQDRLRAAYMRFPTRRAQLPTITEGNRRNGF
jgi:hypothetical protein